jgi:peptidoglycan/LPS O-acetylase OafA/YrhL
MNLKVVLNLFILTVIVAILTFVMFAFIETTEHNWFWGSLIFFFALGIGISAITHRSIKASNSAFFRGVMGAIGIRMLLGVLFLAIYLIASPLKAREFIVYYLILYLLFTIFEIYQLVSKLRPEKNSELDNTTS